MFGFGFGKLLVLAAIVAAVWYGFKFVGRMQEVERNRQRGGGRPAKRGREKPGTVEDTVQCPVCGAYVVARSAAACDRPDCPY
jgi:hypothetical protein